MKCPECGGEKRFEPTEGEPEWLTLWETHKHGCSMSPLVQPHSHVWPTIRRQRTDKP